MSHSWTLQYDVPCQAASTWSGWEPGFKERGGPPSSRIFSIPWTMEKGAHFNTEVTRFTSAHIPLASTGHVVLLSCKGGWEIEPLAWQPFFSDTSIQLGVRNIILWWSAVCFCHHCYCFLFCLPCPSNIGSAWKGAEVRGWGELKASAESDRECGG